jgi:hypothetical protein
VVAYELLTGELPFAGTTLHALMYAHIFQMPTAPHLIRPEIPLPLSDAIVRALSKTRTDRFASMEEFATALWPERPVAAGPPEPIRLAAPAVASAPEPTVVTGSTRRRRLVGAGVALAAVLAVVSLLVLGHREPGPGDGGVGVAVAHDSASQADEGKTRSADTTTAPDITTAPVLPAPPPPPAAAAADSSAVSPSPSVSAPPAVPTPRRREPNMKRARPLSSNRADTVTRTPNAPASPAPAGYLTINAVPYGTVSIDGVEIGDTPVVHYQLAPGNHLVRVSREGYRPDSLHVAITAGNEVRVSRTLTRASP